MILHKTASFMLLCCAGVLLFAQPLSAVPNSVASDSVSTALRAGRWLTAEHLLNKSGVARNSTVTRLQLAIVYLNTSRPREADSLFASVDAPAGVAPYRDYWRARAWQRLGETDRAWVVFDQLAGGAIPAISDSAQYAALQLATVLGNRQRIARAASRLTERSDNMAAIGWLSIMENDSTRWREAWDVLRTRYPGTIEAYRATERALARGWRPTGDQCLALANIYSRRGDVEPALRQWNAALEDPGLASRKREIQFTVAEYLIGRRKFEDAAPYLSALLADSSDTSRLARVYRLHATMFLKSNNEEQMRAWERRFISRFPRNDQVPAALFGVGMSWERESRFSDAISVYEEIITRFPDRAQTEEARWRMGFCQYRLAQFDAAQWTFAPLARSARDFVIKDQAGYWLGLALKARGLSDEARAEWQRTAAFSPRSFYAVASAVACGAPVVKRDSVNPAADELSARPIITRSWDGYGDAQWLALLGQWRFARALLEHTTSGDATSINEMESLADAYESLADYGAALKWRWRAMWKRTTDDRHHELAPDKLARVFPDFFHDDVRKAAAENGIEPALVWSIIRQESVFDPEARSGADARGLMQIIPPTGATLARQEGISGYSAQDLYDPGLNIRLGTRYAAQQLREFGSIDLMAAAYNAGPHNAVRWKIDDPDVQREAISFGETRKYVKLVLRNYYIYKALYGE